MPWRIFTNNHNLFSLIPYSFLLISYSFIHVRIFLPSLTWFYRVRRGLFFNFFSPLFPIFLPSSTKESIKKQPIK